MRASKVVVLVTALAWLAGCDEEKVNSIQPDIAVERTEVDFGVMRVGSPADDAVTLRSRSRAELTIVSVTIEDAPDAPGGAKAFSVVEPVTVIPGEDHAPLKVRFTPDAVAEYAAVLVIESDDPDTLDAKKRVRLIGRGALPKVRVLPDCTEPCKTFVATETPPAIDFKERPPLRRDGSGKIVNEPVWPEVQILNDGEIPLKLNRVFFEGDAAFSAKGSLNTEGVSIDQGGGQIVKVVFDPPQGTKKDFAADLVILSDDPERPEIRVKLVGRKADNAPPTVCGSIVKVDQPDGSEEFPLDGGGKKRFGGAVSVQPAALVYLSPFSDYYETRNPILEGDQSKCTTDVEDGRALLQWQWTIVERPRESKALLIGDKNPEPRFKPDAIGRYKLKVEAKDTFGAVGEAFIEFDAIPKRDLVVQLTWENQPGIDLDVHLVRPAGPSCGGGSCVFHPRNDVNGFSWFKRGGQFDWGGAGGHDDPRLDFDDQGDKALIENVNLNFPENDPECRTSECTYDVYVHYFKDARTSSGSAPTCAGAGCREGDVCNCAVTDTVCVSGRCVKPVNPLVKIFVKPTPSKPDPVLTVPMPSEVVSVGGPCFMWHVARVKWPSKATATSDPDYLSKVEVTAVGQVNLRTFEYYGTLPKGSFSCSPNTPSSTPDADVTYLKVPWSDRPEYQ
ncbi:MAG: choice-of-anchor D domain-containing protein [Myxococcales bacterium]